MSISFALALCRDWSFQVLGGDGLRHCHRSHPDLDLGLSASPDPKLSSRSIPSHGVVHADDRLDQPAELTVAERHGSGNGASLCAMPGTAESAEGMKNPAETEVTAGEAIPESGRPDSNRRRPAWEAGILPLNYARGTPET
jgi:hypothetical protein